MPPTPPAAGQEIVLAIGDTIQLRHATGKDIKTVLASRPNIVDIAPLGMNPAFVVVKGMSIGVTTVTLTTADAADGATVYTIRVEPDLSYIRDAVARQFPTARLSLAPGGQGYMVVTGYVESSEEVEPILRFLEGFVGTGRIINGLRVSGVMQVQLEVCVASVNRSEARTLTVNFLQSNQQNFFGSAIPGPNGSLINLGDLTITPRAGVGTFSGQFVNGNATTLIFGLTDRTSALFGFLQALRTEGLAKILANPTLVTLSGRPATFLVGGEEPISSVSTLGAVNVEYKEFGTRLTFLPIVLGDGKIRLDIQPEVSQVFTLRQIGNGGQAPSFSTQRFRNVIEVENGQTVAIGGLLQNLVNATTVKVPVLGDLPFFGALFRSVNYQEQEQELLVLVTARLIDPMDCSQRTTKMPGQETRTPTDFELFLEGILEAPRGQRPLCVDGKYKPAHWWLDQGNSPCGLYGKCGHKGGCAPGAGCNSCDSGGVTYPAPTSPAALPVGMTPAPAPAAPAPVAPTAVAPAVMVTETPAAPAAPAVPTPPAPAAEEPKPAGPTGPQQN
jgi:pilus assembly protein CpaC